MKTKMQKAKNDKTDNNVLYVFASALLAVILITIVFKAAGRFPGDKHIFMVGDYYVQFMNYIVMFWRKLLSGNGLFYSFDVGLGASTWEQYAFYGFSPFNLVFVFIKDTDTAAFVLLLCKVAAIAVSMHLFLRYTFKLKEVHSVFFSVSYALCAYVMNFYFCIVLIDYLYMLPIVMLMLVRFFKSGKAGGLAFAYAYCFVSAYYGGYMIGIFSFVCFLCMLFSGQYDTRKKEILLKYSIAVAVAVLSSAVVTLPTAAAILAGHGGNSYKGVSLRLFFWDIIGDMYPLRKISESSGIPSVYAGLVTLFFGIAYFTNGKRSGKEKLIAAIPLIFLAICSTIAPAYLMMHGFDAPDGYHFRFAYLYSFYMIAVAAKEVKESDMSLDKLPIIITAAMYPVVIFLGKLSLPDALAEIDSLRMGLVLFLLLIYYFIFTAKSRHKTLIISAMLILELFINAYFAITPDKQTLVRWKDTYDLWQLQGEKALAGIREKEEGDDFYRVNYRDGMWANDSMYFGFHGLGYFSSMEQPDTRAALKDLGYSTSGRVVAERGGSPFTEMIFAQKYRVKTSPDLRLDEPEKVEVEKNELSLPLAFMVSGDINNAGDTGNNAFVNQEQLLGRMLGYQASIWEEYEGDINVEADNAEIIISPENVSMIRKEAGTASLSLGIPAKEGKDAYAYFSSDNSALDWSSPIMWSDKQGEGIGIVQPVFVYMPSIVPLGDDDGQSRLYVSFRETTADSVAVEGLHFAYFDEEALRRAYEELAPGGIKISSMKDDQINGSIRVNAGKEVLFTSIPYEKSWHIKADGKEVDTFAVLNGAFLAAKLGEGEHEIEIYYDNIYIRAGAVISLVGIVILAAFEVISRRRKNGEKA